MENTEEIMQVLERFTRLKQKDIPKELDEYLQYVAKTGDTIFKWPTLKYLFREKFLSVIKHFHDTSPRVDDLPQYPNVDPFNYESLKSALLERLELFNAAPFTVQRLCELLIDPRKQYSRIDKFMRALEKNILVSTVEPGRKRDESENGDSLDSVVNGDLSLDVNVDIDMENESIFNIDVKTKLSHTPPLQQQSQQKSSSQSPTQIQQTSSTPVHRSDDEILPNPKKQKLDVVEKVHEDDEFTDKIISPEKEATIIIPSAEDSNIIKISPNTENKEIYPSKETDEKNESEIGVVKLTPTESNDKPETEEKKVETAHFFADKIDNKTELVTIKKLIDSNNINETSTSNYTDIDKTNSKVTSFLQNEINNEESSNEADNLQLDSESKETAETLETDIVSTVKDVNTKNDEEDNSSFTPSKPETKVENENDSPAIHITSELENEKTSENSKNEIVSKNDENSYKESIDNSTTVCENENEIITDNSKLESKIEEHEQVGKLEEKEEVFDEIVEPTKETVENILKIELPTTSDVISSAQNDQPMEDNAENSLPPAVTINNISLVIPENTVSVDEVIMGDSVEMATDPVEPLIKDESASMEIDDTSQEAMDQ